MNEEDDDENVYAIQQLEDDNEEVENEDENENAWPFEGMKLKILSGLFSLVAQYFDVFADVEAGAGAMYQERIKGLRELIPQIGSIPIVIPLKIFLDLLWRLLFPRGLIVMSLILPVLTGGQTPTQYFPTFVPNVNVWLHGDSLERPNWELLRKKLKYSMHCIT